MKKSISRRGFLQQSGVGLAATSLVSQQFLGAGDAPASMPTRILGKTGLKISLLSFGGGSQFLLNKDGAWESMLEKSLKAGINLYDTSSNYVWRSNKSSEERFGEVLSPHRRSIILSTKIETRDVSEGLAEFEQSLKRMKTDYVDILLIHSIEPSEDIAALEKGLYKEIVRLKEGGAAKFIGFSSMNSSKKSKEVMESLDIDVAILAMNPTKYGDFAEVALPVAIQKNVGVIAMKAIRGLLGPETTAKELLHYVWSQPGVASAVVGHVGMETFEENVRLACEFPKQARALNRQALEKRVAHLAGPHALCWARPGYRDGSA
jgi:uncharacterized protein